MTINKEISRQEHSSVKLTLTVAKDDVRSQYEEVLNNHSKNLQLPGFRRGKIPHNVLIRKFGDALKTEALGNIIEKSVAEVFENENLPRNERPLPYSAPRLEGKPELDLENDFSFSMIYDVFPDVKPGVWKGFEVEAPEAELSDDDVNRELEAIRERNALVFDREDADGAETGNVVTVTCAETDDKGQTVPGTERQDYVFTLGKGDNAYQFDDEILGMKKGETREFVKTYPPEEKDAAAGKTVKFRVSLTALKERRLPDLDDELAQDVNEKFNSLEDLKNSIRASLSRNLEQRLRGIKIRRILDKICGETPAEIPESMIRIELDSRWRNLARAFGTTTEEMKKNMAKGSRTVENLEDAWRPDAVKALHSQIIVETLIEELKLDAGDEELEKEIADIAAAENAPAEDIKTYYKEDQARERLRDQIKERKFFDMLLAENTVKPGKKENYLDLMSGND
ncbi:MAG: trigger factor [Treponema sp.]|nr:trigger factor [Treponema sp.]